MGTKLCECCKGREIGKGPQKYCTQCSLYTKELRRQLSYHRIKAYKKTKEIYGTKSGSQRVRLR